MATTIMVTHGNQKNHSVRVQRSTDHLSKMEIEFSPLTFSTSPCEATRIRMLSLALIQSGKTLISVQYPGNSHHAEEKKKLESFISDTVQRQSQRSSKQSRSTDSYSQQGP